ncbi:MAG: glutamyl-tRNA reductase [Chloroflexi bacterium]|nr:glutamyl-tRNA reductase [Chloroflexota bacterium]
MNILFLGLNHKTAPVEIRERLAISPGRIGETLAMLRAAPGVSEVALVSTCNRFEIYAVVDDPVVGQPSLVNALAEARDVCACDFACHLRVLSDADAVKHVCRVAAGLDSLLIGEHQILGQIKDALQAAHDAGSISAILAALFRQAITAGKRAHSETEIGRGARSLGQVAVSLARDVLGDLENRTALLIGAGKIGKLAGRALVESGLKWILVANRTYDRASQLARELNGRAVHFDALADGLAQADVVIAASGAPHLVLHAADIERAMAARAQRPLVVVDLAVPRNVDPAIRNIPHAHLYDMDDLSAVVATHHPVAAVAVAAAERIADEETQHFLAFLRERQVAPLVQDLLAHAETIRQTEVAKAFAHLGNLTPEQQRAVDALATSLVHKLVFNSIHTIKEMPHR